MKYIPYGRQSIDKSDIQEVIEVLNSDWITQGPKINEFEDALCKYTGAKYAVAVSSGTAGLHLACLVAGIRQGDEVITSPITFVASANCILYCGGKPVFVDIEPDTANIDLYKVEYYLKTQNSKVKTRIKAIIPVHFAGHPCNLEKINKIAKGHNLIVIEDACHALGAEYKNTKIGSCRYSDMTVFSFHPVKSITTGEGGAVLTNRKDFYEKLLMLRNHGITKDPARFINKKLAFSHTANPWYYEMQELGFNYRITDFQCALGISQLKKIDDFIEKRRALTEKYKKHLSYNPYFDLPVEREYAKSSWHLYSIRLKEKYIELKKDIFNLMRKKGIGVQVHYMPVYFHPYYKRLGYKKGLCLNAEKFYKREISIPLYQSMGHKQAVYVINTIMKTFKDR